MNGGGLDDGSRRGQQYVRGAPVRRVRGERNESDKEDGQLRARGFYPLSQAPTNCPTSCTLSPDDGGIGGWPSAAVQAVIDRRAYPTPLTWNPRFRGHETEVEPTRVAGSHEVELRGWIFWSS